MMNTDDPIVASGLGKRLSLAIEQLQKMEGAALPSGILETLFEFSNHAEQETRWVRAAELARSLAVLLGGYDGASLDAAMLRQRETMVDSLHRLLNKSEAQLPQLSLRELLVPPIAPTQPRAGIGVAILVDQPGLVHLLHEPLQTAGFEPCEIASIADLDGCSDALLPVALIADLDLCQLDGHFAEDFAALARRYEVPPHLLTLGRAEDVEARLGAVRLGATRFFSKPLDVGRLIAVLRGVTAQTAVSPFRVLLVDDDQVMGELYRAILTKAGMEVSLHQSALQVPGIVREFDPDVIVSDLYMPGCNGMELVALLRQDESLADIPIVLISGDDATEVHLEAFDLGADDFLAKPVPAPVLVAILRARAKRSRTLRRRRSEFHRMNDQLKALERNREAVNAPAQDSLLDSALAVDPRRAEGYEVSELDAGSRQGPRTGS